MKPQKMLKASEHNWGLMGPGDWRETVWEVNYDGTYKITSVFNPIMDPNSVEIPKTVKQSTTGSLNDDEFSKLKALLEKEKWRTPGVMIEACDGTAWKIDFYSPEGKIQRNSGKLGYIYGEKVLEKIAHQLCKLRDD